MSLSRVVTIAIFAIALVMFVGVEWVARREDSKIPTISDMCAFVMRYTVGRLPVGRVAVLGFWWWIGWHFFAR